MDVLSFCYDLYNTLRRMQNQGNFDGSFDNFHLALSKDTISDVISKRFSSRPREVSSITVHRVIYTFILRIGTSV